LSLLYYVLCFFFFSSRLCSFIPLFCL
jgi:hypothetical protein